MRRYSVKGCT
jgi:hypothetical protein